MFEFLQPFCAVSSRQHSAFQSAPLNNISNHNDHHSKQQQDAGSLGRTYSTETETTADDDEDASAVYHAHVQYEKGGTCGTSLTSSMPEEDVHLLLQEQQQQQGNHSQSYFSTSLPLAAPIPASITFFQPRVAVGTVAPPALHRLVMRWSVRRGAASDGMKGLDAWTGHLHEVSDAREDTDGLVGEVSCYRISPDFSLPSSDEEKQRLARMHPHLALLADYMTPHGAAGSRSLKRPDEQQQQQALFGLPLLLIADMQVTADYRGTGLGLLLVDEACRCLANPAQWVLLPTEAPGLRDYFNLLGFVPSGLLNGSVIIRWNDTYTMATHRYQDLCPHLPTKVVVQ
jgi:hypothetical protein